MPRRKTSIKKKRQDKKKHLRNFKAKSQIKKTLKKFQALILEKKLEEAKEFLKQVYTQLDKAAKKQIIHPNTANRKKSRLALRLAKAK
ncbi:MAG: 30S ribosomal protein S20 [Candidatus Omnitrophica bacterium]|nr:30S ribosomal protein S20 [Candidatus Omnitrophota bacterium]MDD5652531.1 30S ribosomal protein S20 [Candidatus Omnitrophota bacterium]